MSDANLYCPILWLLLTLPVLADDPLQIAIWPDVAPGSSNSVLRETFDDRPITDGTDVTRDRHVRDVTKPTLTIYLPETPAKDRPLVVVIPGGGFNILAIDKEGHDVARWLQSQGIAGAVLKYRLPDPDVGLYVRNGSLVDVQRAIRLVRHHADQWNVDPSRIGVTGFSAGGYLTAAAGTIFDQGDSSAEDPVQRESCRPDFMAPIYPLIDLEIDRDEREDRLKRMLGPQVTDQAIAEYSPNQRVTENTPRAFLVHAHDDRLPSEHSVRFYQALKRAGISAELHLYSQGGHGFGIRRRGLPVSDWPARWLAWMRAEGIIASATDE